MVPLVQKAKETSGSHHISAATESSKAGPAEAPQDTWIEKSTQISCSVKEEISADGQEMGEGMQHLNFKSLGWGWGFRSRVS